jgi:hypothetical protein
MNQASKFLLDESASNSSSWGNEVSVYGVIEGRIENPYN